MTRRARRLLRRATVVAGAALGLLAAGRHLSRERLRGQRVLITGGSRGLGLALARRLAAKGCHLALIARDPDELERARQDLRLRGVRVVTAVCDVASEAQVATAVDHVERTLGPIDILVNNAGILQMGPLSTMNAGDFRAAIDVMYLGTVHTTLAVLPSMRARRRGRIVNVASIGGKVPVPHLLPYVGAKFAAVGFSEGLAVELAGTGIRVTTVLPGLMRTGSVRNALIKGRRELELAWLSLSASLPIVSISAERAAARIVAAIERDASEVVLTAPARLSALLHGLWPTLSTRLLGAINRLLLPAAPPNGTGPADRGQLALHIEPQLPQAIRQLTEPARAPGAWLNQPSS